MTRKDSRRTVLPKIVRIRLYVCSSGHQIETVETIVGGVKPITRDKMLINRFTVRTEEGKSRADDYQL